MTSEVREAALFARIRLLLEVFKEVGIDVRGGFPVDYDRRILRNRVLLAMVYQVLDALAFNLRTQRAAHEQSRLRRMRISLNGTMEGMNRRRVRRRIRRRNRGLHK
jgi:hypothetical protein